MSDPLERLADLLWQLYCRNNPLYPEGHAPPLTAMDRHVRAEVTEEARWLMEQGVTLIDPPAVSV